MSRGLIWVFAIGGLLLVGLAEGQPPAPGKAGPALDKETLALVRKLQEKRRDVLRRAIDTRFDLYQFGRIKDGEVVVQVVGSSKRLLAVELDLATTRAERIAAHERHLGLAQKLAAIAKSRFENPPAGAMNGPALMLDGQAALLEAQIGLLKAGGKLKNDKRAAEPMEVVPPPKRLLPPNNEDK